MIGQTAIQNELTFLLQDVRDGNNYNILFRAASGWGKTKLGLLCLNTLGLENSYYYIPEGGVINNFYQDRRFHFIDEVHTLTIPEVLYPLMDSSQYTFFFATNESGNVKEPLVNRCIELIFSPYTDDEKIQMIRSFLPEETREEFILEVLNRSTTPRSIKNICNRLNYIFKARGFPESLEELNNILENIMQIRAGGLTNLDEIYLDFLRRTRRSSLISIVNATGLDKNTILRDIEPRLLYNRVISITSKGRELC